MGPRWPPEAAEVPPSRGLMNGSVVQCPRCGRRNRVPAAREGVPRCASCGAGLPWIVDASDDDFASVAGRSTLPVLVDLWAEWCAPCRQIAPIIAELAAEYGDRVKIVKMDIDKSPNTPGQYGIRAIPTILAFKGGRVVQQIQGARPKADFKKMVEELLA